MQKTLSLIAGLLAMCIPYLALETPNQYGTVEGIVVRQDTGEPIPNVSKYCL